MEKAKLAVVGLGVMGQNLALNIANKGYPVAVFNRTESVTRQFVAGLPADQGIVGTYSYVDLAASLEKPRRIML
ncbi:MAG: NAD(P)-binding domain-containing protein, partial [Anaerolineaceae bacterium]